MSSCGGSSGSPCCQSARLLMDEFCENFNVNDTAEIIWADTIPQEATFTLSVSPDSDASANFIVTIPAFSVPITLAPGQSITRIFLGALSLSVASASATLLTTGTACITIMRKL